MSDYFVHGHSLTPGAETFTTGTGPSSLHALISLQEDGLKVKKITPSRKEN